MLHCEQEKVWRRLPHHLRRDASRRFERGNCGAGARDQLCWIWVGGVAIRCDQPRASADGGGGELKVARRALTVQANGHPSWCPGGERFTVGKLRREPRRKTCRAQFGGEPLTPVDQDPCQAGGVKTRRNEAHRRQQPLVAEGGATRFDPRAILSTTEEAVVGDVHDLITRSVSLGQQGSNPWDRVGTSIEHTVKVKAKEHGAMVDQEWKLLGRAERVLVDGNNLVGGWDEVRLRAYETAIHRSLPASAKLEVFRDGGGRSADDRIIEAVGRPDPSRADRIVIVTDDRELRDRARRLGASTITARYFRDRIAANTLAPTTTRATGGFGRVAPKPPVNLGKDEGPEERRWQPGRGATKKRGPSARPPRGR